MRSQEDVPRSAIPPVTFDTVPFVETRRDLLRIARAVEREAADRYAALVAEAERRRLGALADVFRRLELAEREHLDRVKTLDGEAGGDMGEAPGFARSSRMSETGEFSSNSIEDLDILTPWGVLDLALTNEERAFAFYTRVAAKTSDPEARSLAETLASEELDHVAWLRLHRLKAWPGEREARDELRPEAGFPSSKASLQDLKMQARQIAEETMHRLEKVKGMSDSSGRDLLLELYGIERGSVAEEPSVNGDIVDTVREEALRADLLYRSWITVCEKTKNEDVLRFAQEEASKTLGALARLRDLR
jgi:rubrerythrin